MKRLLLLLGIGLIGLSSCMEQGRITKAKVPGEVKKTFDQSYPDIDIVEWSKKGDDYEAEFKQYGREFEVMYNEMGDRIAVEEEILVTELPSKAHEYIDANYPDFIIDEVDKIKTNQGQYFEVDLVKGDEEAELIFSNQGMIRKTKDEDN